MRTIAAALVAVTIALLPLAGTWIYVSMWRAEYFRTRYEDAYQALAVAALASLASTVAMLAFALVWPHLPMKRR
jgi:hypothetical protein